MRAALAELKLPKKQQAAAAESLDLDADSGPAALQDWPSPRCDQDFRHFIPSSDLPTGFYGPDLAPTEIDETPSLAYSPDWFAAQCALVAAQNDLSPDVLETEIMATLSSSHSEDQLQSQLTDLIGFHHLDFVIELLARKDDILAAAVAQQLPTSEPAGHRLLTKSEREEALRLQDFQHKSTALGPSQSREPQYPHVYKAYHAGNSLSISGKKYGLPVGSQRLQFDKYEEYSIPAGLKGVPGPGEKLVGIADLDGLCRNTFKGYKNLNRMQSLVYPVAYKTSENMLICAPTGAVGSP